MPKRKKLFVAVLTMVILAAGINYARKRPPIVVVGPVEPGVGLCGVVDENTPRHETIAILGEPLKRGETWEQAVARGASDPMPDYFGGIYAEVGWYITNIPRSLEFDLDSFSGRYATEQVIVISHAGKCRQLSRKIKFSEAKKPGFGKSLGFTNKQYDPGYLTISCLSESGKELMMLYFGTYDEHLSRISIKLHQ